MLLQDGPAKASPTSEIGKITKSSPVGSLDEPFNPVSIALGAEASFVGRTHDMDRKHMQEIFKRANEHKGASLVEVYQERFYRVSYRVLGKPDEALDVVQDAFVKIHARIDTWDRESRFSSWGT